MRLDDLADNYERTYFAADGLAFVLKGDFEKKGVQAYAIVGKDEAADASIFFAILAVRRGKLALRHFEVLTNPRASLLLWPRCHKGFDGIAIVYTPRTDHGEFRVWSGGRYRSVPECDRQ